MNRYDLATQMVMPYVLEEARHAEGGMEHAHNKAIAVIENAAAIKAAYPFMRDIFLNLQKEKQSPSKRLSK
jgi:hypothetical protein